MFIGWPERDRNVCTVESERDERATAPAVATAADAASSAWRTWRAGVPTNAFQRGTHGPVQRAAALVAPAPRLFVVGALSAAAGYSAAGALTRVRRALALGPAPMPAVPVAAAAAYTGAFLVLVSNPLYQVLQGVVELRVIEPLTRRAPAVRAALIMAARIARGLLGSALAIRGMQMTGLMRVGGR